MAVCLCRRQTVDSGSCLGERDLHNTTSQLAQRSSTPVDKHGFYRHDAYSAVMLSMTGELGRAAGN
jgi:hypothetical protein